MTTNRSLLEKYLSHATFADSIAESRRPIVLYGTGNGADKIIKVLSDLGRRPDAVFASSGFVRNRTYADLPVLSFEEVVREFGHDIDILMCFGSDREEVISRAESLDGGFDFYLPDVPLYGDGLFDRAYVTENVDRLAEVRGMLTDEDSVALFDECVLYRLTGKIKYLSRTQRVRDTYRELFRSTEIKRVCDCGAYKGDSARVFAEVFPNLKKIYALEPDPGTFKKLVEQAALIRRYHGVEVEPVCAAASDREGEVAFSSSSSRGAGALGKNRRSKSVTVRTAPLDKLIRERLDLIKLDVEGDERRALDGAKRIINDFSPSLAVSLYHRTDDLAALPLLVKSFGGEYKNMKYYLRRPRCLPCWDLALCAVKQGD